MSKYIRTKDEIREYEEVVKCIKYWHTNVVMSDDKDKDIKCDIETYNKSIIKQADTIEELCDVFIDGNCLNELNGCFFEKYENKALWFKPQDKLELRPVSILEWTEEERIKIKGAIWTDKGLIYVAKMNEKGELELL